MKATITVEKEFEIKYLEVDANVRYWDDDKVIRDEEDPDIQDDAPKMPGAELVDGDWRWRVTIDVDNGTIVGWPKGTTASVHYKVCDEGVYTLLDKDNKVIERVESYVPDCLAPMEDGWGDYIILDIDRNGKIEGFEFDQSDVDEIIEAAF